MTVILPNTSYNPKSDIRVDFRVNTEMFKYGGPAHHVGIAASAPEDAMKDTRHFIKVVKVPGSNKHFYPEGFEEIGQMAADDQYSLSKLAKMKYCVMGFRRAVLNDEKPLFPPESHVHDYPWFMEPLIQGLSALSDHKAGGLHPGLILTDPWLSKSEYLYTNIEPTLVQAEISTTDLGDRLTMKEVASDSNAAGCIRHPERLHVERVPVKSLTLLTAEVFHRPPKIEEYDAENIGKTRTLVSITYLSPLYLHPFVR